MVEAAQAVRRRTLVCYCTLHARSIVGRSLTLAGPERRPWTAYSHPRVTSKLPGTAGGITARRFIAMGDGEAGARALNASRPSSDLELDAAVGAAWADVRSSASSWLALGYAPGSKKKVVVLASGDGGYASLRQHLTEKAIVRVCGQRSCVKLGARSPQFGCFGRRSCTRGWR